MKRLLYIILISCGVEFTVQSIAGVTYKGHFDFEQRYRDMNECNPTYWYPLHLPEKCLVMFEELLRRKLSPLPYRVVQENPKLVYDSPALVYPYIYEPILADIYEAQQEVYTESAQEMSPMEVLFELLKQDVRNVPSAPSLGVSPYLGVIAMYKQPVSSKSVAMIKKIAKAYANSGFYNYNTGTDDIERVEKDIKVSKKMDNGTLVVKKVIKSNDAMTLLKI